MQSETAQAPHVCHSNHIPVIASVPFSQHPAQTRVLSSGTLGKGTGKGIYTEYKEALSVAIFMAIFQWYFLAILITYTTTPCFSPKSLEPMVIFGSIKKEKKTPESKKL